MRCDKWANLPLYLSRPKTVKVLSKMGISHEHRREFEFWHDQQFDLPAHCRSDYFYTYPKGSPLENSNKGPSFKTHVLGQWLDAANLNRNSFAAHYKRKIHSAYEAIAEVKAPEVEGNLFASERRAEAPARPREGKDSKWFLKRIHAILLVIENEDERVARIRSLFQ